MRVEEGMSRRGEEGMRRKVREASHEEGGGSKGEEKSRGGRGRRWRE